MTWWWCLEHKRTEQDEGCRSANRLGPYNSKEQAETAIARTRARSAEQDTRDQAEDEWRER